MLISLFKTHSDPEDVKKELKQDRLNQQKEGKGCEGFCQEGEVEHGGSQGFSLIDRILLNTCLN